MCFVHIVHHMHASPEGALLRWFTLATPPPHTHTHRLQELVKVLSHSGGGHT